MPDPAIQIENLSAAYGAVTALRSANLTIQRGEIFGLLGPNGAGKTTLLSCLEGLHAPKEGAVRIAGETPARAKARLGIQLQKTALLDDLTVVELIELYAGLYNVFLTRAQIEALLARWSSPWACSGTACRCP
jgi:ABC-2 type transport system ATP-binding protein